MANTNDNDTNTTLVTVSSYTRFDNLAHGPRGKEATYGLRTYRFNSKTGELTLNSVIADSMNPAFSVYHPSKNILYSCTESVAENGIIDAFAVNAEEAKLERISSHTAGGTSTCYLSIDQTEKNMLVCNYWDSTLPTIGLDANGGFASQKSVYDPTHGRKMKEKSDKHVNHSRNDAEAQAQRMGDPHSHAVVLDPVTNGVAYVPDLGMDLIRQFRFDPITGRLSPAGTLPSGPAGEGPHGPRYLTFHPTLPVAYVVNELSCKITTFTYDVNAARRIASSENNGDARTLHMAQTLSTIPGAFPRELNTCSGILVHPSGRFVLVANRGHDSLAVYRVHPRSGSLKRVGIFHTRGQTPRHFNFDPSGQWLIVANQDTDNLVVFRFNTATGEFSFSGFEYQCNSPNFVCIYSPYTSERANTKANLTRSSMSATTVSAETSANSLPKKSVIRWLCSAKSRL